MTLYLSNYTVKIAGDLRYYVGLASNDPDNTTGKVICRVYMAATNTPIAFPDGNYYKVIAASGRGKTPGFVIRGTTLLVEVASDDVGGALLYYSNDGGYTWLEA